MAWHDVVLALDTETTGLTGKAEIIELGLVFYYRGCRVREWSSFFHPQLASRSDPDVQRAMEVNCIPWEHLESAPTFRSKLEEIEKEMSEAVWVAHNAEFDVRMLHQEYKRLGHTPRHQPQIVLCTKLLDFLINPGKAHYKLGDVSGRWGVAPDGAHRAVVDARACGDVASKMIEAGKLPDDLAHAVQQMQIAEKQWRSRPKGVW